jgi:hypothetical protein
MVELKGRPDKQRYRSLKITIATCASSECTLVSHARYARPRFPANSISHYPEYISEYSNMHGYEHVLDRRSNHSNLVDISSRLLF